MRMDSEDDYSDYEDEEARKRCQLFPLHDDLSLLNIRSGINGTGSEVGAKNCLLPDEESHEDSREFSTRFRGDISPSLEDPGDGSQYRYSSGCGRLQTSTDTSSSLSSGSERSVDASVPPAAGPRLSRYSRLLSLINRAGDVRTVNGIQGGSETQNAHDTQAKTHLRNPDSINDLIRPVPDDPSKYKAPGCISNDTSYSSDIESSNTVPVCLGALPSSLADTNSHLSANGTQTSDRSNVVLPESSCNTLKGGADRNEFRSIKLKDVNTSGSSNAQQLSNTRAKNVMCTRYSDDVAKIATGTNFKEGSTSHRERSSFERLKEQLKIFRYRVKVYVFIQMLPGDPSQDAEVGSKLQVHVDQLVLATSPTDLTRRVSGFTSALQGDVLLANCFFANFISYVQSVLDLEKDLAVISELLEYLIPCVNVVVSGGIEQQAVNNIRNDNLLPVLYQTVVKTFNRETKYTDVSISELLTYQWDSKALKAHISRMSPKDSQRLFQETFSDVGSPSDLYLIYAWHILKIYDLGESNTHQAVAFSLTDSMEESGRFISIVPAKSLKAKALKIPIGSQIINRPSPSEKENTTARDTSNSAVDLTFEWADFRIGQLYENGMAFLTNMANWMDHLQEISLSIKNLEVKRKVKFMPSLGSTYALALQDGLRVLNSSEEVSYIRVRVVRSAGPVARVYGIDTGSIHACDADNLILLPASILSHPPCGRLALLPVVPAPDPALLSPTLTLLAALAQHPQLAQDLSSIDVWPMASWMQVNELTQMTFHLMQAIVKALPASSLLPDVCSIITDYLVRITVRKTQDPVCTSLAFSVLISAMRTSSKLRLYLAKEGAFITLSGLALKFGQEGAWEVIRTLLGGGQAMEKWSSLSSKVSRIQHKRNFSHWESHSWPVSSSVSQPNSDTSLPVMQVAAMTVPDRNWDLEVRWSIRSRQLVPYQSHGGWRWKEEQVLPINVGELHYGHVLNVHNNETHHIILDKSIPNIRMNTLLQITLGMLNTGLGGKIYIGLNQSGIVHGVKMNRDQRDCFMLGFSKLVTSEIFPMVLPCDSLIQLIPVIRPGALHLSSQTPANSPHHPTEANCYVVILTVRPQPNLVYRYRDDPEPLFLREGGVTTTTRGQRLAQLNTIIAGKTRELQQQVTQEKQQLLNLILNKESQHG